MTAPVSGTPLSAAATNVNWLLNSFIRDTIGVHQAVAVSSDGLLVAMSSGVAQAHAERFAAITSAMMSLSRGAATTFGATGVNQVMVEMYEYLFFVSSISDGSALGVVTAKDVDLGAIGYETTMLVDRVGEHLSPEVISELKLSIRSSNV